MRRRTIRSLIVAASVAAASVATMGTAAAAPGNCPSGYECMWQDIHYYTSGSQTSFFQMYLDIPFMYQWYFPNGVTVDKQVSSAFNNGTGAETVYFYEGYICSGRSFTMLAGVGDSDFTNGTPTNWADNDASSAAFASRITSCQNGN